MTTPASPAASTVDAVQRRTVRTLVVSQAVGAVGVTIGVATASLLARDISGSETMAGLAQTFQVLGTAAAAYVLARLMRRRGRRVGLVTGYLIGRRRGGARRRRRASSTRCWCCSSARVLLGATTAVNSGSRYAATDLATEEHRARALSVVVWATTDRRRRRPQPHRASAARSPGPLGHPRAHRRVRHRRGRARRWRPGWVVVRLRPDPLLLAQAAAGVAPEPTAPSRAAGRGAASWPSCATCRPSARPSSGWPAPTRRW